MERLVLAIVAISAVAAGSAGGGAVPAARAAAPAGSWGRAIEVPGLGALNKGEDAVVTSVSCASAGNCTAVGDYTDRSGRDRWFGQVFAVSQKNDRWGKAEQIPGTAALNVDDDANVSSVSCASPGNCSAVGDYTGRSGYSQAFVAVQKNGTWGTAERVPGLAALDHGKTSRPASVSCSSAGNYSAGGAYHLGSLNYTWAFVVTQHDGAWGKAEQVPGTSALNTGRGAETVSVSCPPAGRCSAGGYYTDSSGRRQAFVVSQAR